MVTIPLLGLLGFYSLAYYGVDVLKGGNDPFLSLIVPGRYVPGKYPPDSKAAQPPAPTPSVSGVITGTPGGILGWLDPAYAFGKSLIP